MSPSNRIGPVKAGHAILKGPLARVELVVLDEELSQMWRSKVFSQSHILLPDSERRCLVRTENLWSFEVFLDLPKEACLKNEDVKSDCWMQGKCGGA